MIRPFLRRKNGKREKYYDAMRAGMDVKTGLISSGDFENCFRSIMEQNEDVLYFSLSKISVVPLIPQDLQPRL